MKADLIINAVIGTIKVIGILIFILFFLSIITPILSHLLILRNTIIWFLGESGMIWFMTVQAIWAMFATLLFFFMYKIFHYA